MREPSRWSPVPLRLGLGIVMFVHGIGKLNLGPLANGKGVAGVAGSFSSLGLPLPTLFAWLVTLVEAVGGFLVLVGLFTRVAALLLTVDMTAAAVLVHLPRGFSVDGGGYEFTLLLALASLTLVLAGPGVASLEYAAFGRELIPTALTDATTAENSSTSAT